jgi:ERCC4-type nuclease
MKIIIDSREQLSFDFEESEVKKLDEGDYSVEGYEHEVAVERKSVNDAIGSVLQGRERFEKEFIRAKTNLKRFFVVIEGTQDCIKEEMIHQAIMNGKTKRIASTINSVLNTYLHWSVKYNVPIYFCFGREEAKRTTFELLRAYVKYKNNGEVKSNGRVESKM